MRRIRILLLLTVATLCSCEQSVSVRPAVTVACAPQKLAQGESATLTILQIYRRGEPIIKLREDRLGTLALYDLRTQIQDPNEDGSGYCIQVYSIKPRKNMTIDDTFFLNCTNRFPPVTIQVE